MLKRIEGFLKTFDLFKGLFSAILTILLVLSVVLNFVNSTAPLAIWLRENLIWIWLFVLTIFLFTTFYKLDSLEKRLLSGITINLKGNLYFQRA